MIESTRGVEAEANGMTGFAPGVETLAVEALEERITPLLLGIGLFVGGCGCNTSSS